MADIEIVGAIDTVISVFKRVRCIELFAAAGKKDGNDRCKFQLPVYWQVCL